MASDPGLRDSASDTSPDASPDASPKLSVITTTTPAPETDLRASNSGPKPGTSTNSDPDPTTTPTTITTITTTKTKAITPTIPTATPTPISTTPLPPSTPPRPNLAHLPLELLLLITAHLPYPTLALTLPATSKRLHQALNPDHLTTLHPSLTAEKLALYDHADRHFPQHADKLVCFACFRFLERGAFGERQRCGAGGKHGKREGRRQARFCFECGVKGARYEHQRRVRWNGEWWYPCHWCLRARLGGVRCTADWCVAENVPVRGGVSAAVERLPREVVEGVCAWLGYADLLALKRVSRFFRGVVEPARLCDDVYGKWEFVMERIQRRHPLTDAEAPRACFGCFRVREKRQFSRQQFWLSRRYNHGAYWRRRCWDCLRQFYHPRLADVEALARFQRQVLCGVCKCLRYVNEDCRGCVVNADKIAEWDRLRNLSNKRQQKSALGWMRDTDALVPLWLVQEPTAPEPNGAAGVTGPGGAVKRRNRLVTWIALVLRLKSRIRKTKVAGSGIPPPNVGESGEDGTTPGPSSTSLALVVTGSILICLLVRNLSEQIRGGL